MSFDAAQGFTARAGGSETAALHREATEAMVVVMQERATESQIEQVVARLVEMGMDVHRSTGVTRTVLGAVGQGHPDAALIEVLDGVQEVVRISEPYKLASGPFKPGGTVVTL